MDIEDSSPSPKPIAAENLPPRSPAFIIPSSRHSKHVIPYSPAIHKTPSRVFTPRSSTLSTPKRTPQRIRKVSSTLTQPTASSSARARKFTSKIPRGPSSRLKTKPQTPRRSPRLSQKMSPSTPMKRSPQISNNETPKRRRSEASENVDQRNVLDTTAKSTTSVFSRSRLYMSRSK